ncbi:MAG: hypothetical protein ACE5OZ_04960 [Candidatus Heimdallarchaeota archaeon]
MASGAEGEASGAGFFYGYTTLEFEVKCSWGNAMERIEEFKGPFTVKEFAKDDIDPKKAREILNGFVATKKLRSRRIARTYVFWKPKEKKHALITSKEDLSDLSEMSHLKLENQELKLEIEDLRKRLRGEEQLEASDSSPWEAICMDMARSLADMRGMTMKEVLDHFGAGSLDS